MHLISFVDLATMQDIKGNPDNKHSGPIEVIATQYEDRDVALLTALATKDFAKIAAYFSRASEADYMLIGSEESGYGAPVRFVQLWRKVDGKTS